MKLSLLSASLLSLTPALILPTHAAITIPGANGSDGALNITQDTVIDLSKATTGKWDDNNSANAGNGVYDPEKWAVVFKYTSVNVLAGKKLTFKNHATRAPVVWLVSGNVTIAGTVDLSGESYAAAGITFHPTSQPLGGRLAEPGPGGFRGGAAWRGGDVRQAPGFGPGGGTSGASGFDSGPNAPKSGSYGPGNGVAYGNPSLIPLIGGSGGGGGQLEPFPNAGTYGWGGGGGGGAILIGASGSVFIESGASVSALGGNGFPGAGSGGGVRVVCTDLLGAGSISAAGGNSFGSNTPGSIGRVRIERVATSSALTVTPAPSTVDLIDGATAQIWPPSGAPEARIVSVNQIQAPADPNSMFGAYTPDVVLPLVSSVNVIVETINVENNSGTKVIVRVNPRNGMTINGSIVRNATEVNATIKEVVSEVPLKLRWEATVPTLPGYSAIQARIVRP
ncbi:MAG: hypothetical protein ACK5CW_08690 [Verrucomicrobiota bacterium]|jgi:hypothetical protein